MSSMVLRLVAAAAGALALVAPTGAAATSRGGSSDLTLAGLKAPVEVVRDRVGVPHIHAASEYDAYFMVGYLHAQDRLFQMDASRHQAAGTLAELLGPGALGSDAFLRTIGLRRAAARSLAALSPQTVAILEAYADGVNAWLARHQLPSEYATLELSKASVAAWTPLDTVAIAKLGSFGVSFDIGDIPGTQKLLAYRAAGAAQGFDGTRLFFEDTERSEPFAHAPSILPGEPSGPLRMRGAGPLRTHVRPAPSSAFLRPAVADAARQAMTRARAAGVQDQRAGQGSNVWVVSGAKSASGRPMVANDPHLGLPSPAVFYEVGIDVEGSGHALYGVTFPGAPLIIAGTNGHVSWGLTVNPTDVTDFYQEQLVLAGGVPVATTYQGHTEPTTVIPETFRANQPGDGTDDNIAVVPPAAGVPAATIVVPRRNDGPLISVSGTTGLSVQYTGFSPTREPDFYRLLAHADTVGEAIDAQRYNDFGGLNFMYVDDRGNIGYKTSGEIPLREDLQSGTVAGLPPWFIRDGTGGNEWIPDPTPAADQALRYKILPFDELDGLVNPARGWISNANQDPTGQTFDNDPLNEPRPGGGIRYITAGHSDGNRNARITTRLRAALADGKVSFAEMRSIQADVKLNDAEVLVPYITAALRAAHAPGAPAQLAALGADARVQEAVARLAAWDFSTPTGIPEGYDASDLDGARSAPTQAEIDASVAATIYTLWRGRALALILDAPLAARGLAPASDAVALGALRHLLEGDGTGASGIVFFAGPTERDTEILQALKNALDLAAGPSFAPAFGGSTDPADYRWGKLHRITFQHPLGAPFSIPTGAAYTDLAPNLPGIATDGGLETVDAATHFIRATTRLFDFGFGHGPGRRFIAEARPNHPNAVDVIPGGESGNPSGPWFGNQLGLWLTNDYHQATTNPADADRDATLRQDFVPDH